MANVTWGTSDKTANVTLSGSNLVATSSGAAGGARASDRQITGKFYWEVTLTTAANNTTGVGIASAFATLGSLTTSTCVVTKQAGNVLVNNAASGSTLGARASGDLICIALDIDAKLIWFRVGAAGNWNGSGAANPATGAGGVLITGMGVGPGYPLYPYCNLNANLEAVTANFGDTAFTGTAPSGFTGGFTSGATVPAIAAATQAALEEWDNNADARVTQVALEQWVNPASGNVQAILTQIALEEWCSVALLSADTRAMILA